MFKNIAAYVVTEPQKHVEIRDAPYTKPAPNQLVIRNHAVGVNPIDWMLPMFGAFQHIKWPFVLGSDSAGEVVEIGTKVSRFQVGDRVVGQAIGYDEKINTSNQSSFQIYTVLLEDMTSHIPDQLPYEQASVLPLGLGTAATGLFQQDHLALHLPSINPIAQGKVVIVWGGSTSVGANAIQLAIAAGYEVFTTCSPRNFEFCKSLGAAQCFDYKSPTIRADITRALTGKIVAGAMTIGDGGAEAIMDIFPHCQGDKAIAMVSFPKPPHTPQRFVTAQTIFYFLKFVVLSTLKARMRNIRWKFVNGSTLAFNSVGKAVYGDYLDLALEKGMYQCKPDAMVVGHGLEKVQEALDVQRKGVSARKVVFTL